MTIKGSDLCYSAFIVFYVLSIDGGKHWTIKKGYLKGIKVIHGYEYPLLIYEFEDDNGNTFCADRKCDIAIDEACALRECNRRNGVSVEMQECDFDGLTELNDKFVFVSALEMERDRLAYENDRLTRAVASLSKAKEREKAVIKQLQKRYNIPRKIINKLRSDYFNGAKS